MGRKEILIDDIETKAEDKIIARYPSFRQAKDKADENWMLCKNVFHK